MYHITEQGRVESIMKLGLLPGGPENIPLGRMATGNYVFLCDTAKDALQLAPPMISYYKLRKDGEERYKGPMAKYLRFEDTELLLALLSVDVSGLPLRERMNRAAEPWLYEGKTILVKEYLCPKTILPDRILNVRELSFFYKKWLG